MRHPRGVAGRRFVRWALGAVMLLLAAGVGEAQTTNSYRSTRTGFWDQAGTWQRYSGSAWVAATAAPVASNAATITVRSGHAVTVRNALTANEIVVQAGAKMVVGASLTLTDGAGDELAVNGTVETSQTTFVQGASTVAVNNGGLVNILGGAFQFGDSSQGFFHSGSEVSVGSVLSLPSQNAAVRFYAGSVARVRPGKEVTSVGLVEMAGTLVNEGTVLMDQTGRLTVQSGGVYQHARNGGAFPDPARTTWRAGSTAEITGFVDALPTGLQQSFHHLTWNSPGQTADAELNGQIAAISGNLTITNTNGLFVNWNRSGNVNLAVGGDFRMTAGRFAFDYNGTGTMTVNGSVTVSGGVFWINGNSGTTTLRVRGNAALTGSGVVRSWTEGQAAIVLDGAGGRSVTASGTFTGEIKLRIESSVQATLQSDLVLNDNLEIVAGSSLDANGYDITVGDDLQVFGALVNSNRVTFTSTYGTTAALLANAPVSIPEIVIDTDGDPFVFDGAAVTVTTRMRVRAGGVEAVNGATLAVASGAVYQHARNGGSLPSRAATTWRAGSTCEITGVTNTLPTGLDQSFHHLTWSNAGQSSSWALGLAIRSIGGTFTIGSTGSGGFYWIQDGTTPLAIGGDYIQTGGLFVYSFGNGSGPITVAGNVTVSGGAFQFSTGTGSPTLRAAGDVSLTGGGSIGTAEGRSAAIVLNGTAPQTLTASGTIGNQAIRVTLDNASGVTAGSDLDLPSDLTVQTGTLNLAGRSLAVGGNLQVAGALGQPGRLTFDGAGNQSYDYAGRLSVPRIVIASGGTVRLLRAALDVTRGITVTKGTLDLNGQPVALKSVAGRTATLYREGAGASVAGDANLSVERAFGTATDGWRMVTVPLAGVPYSALNAPFHTQGAEWTRTSAGAASLQRLDAAAQSWVELDGADASFAPGVGYILYLWQTDPNSGAPRPTTWTVTGPVSTLASVPLGFNGSASGSHNLVGNPGLANLDWAATVAASSNVGTSYATWNPAVTGGGGMSGYVYYNSAGGTGAAGPHISPFQAFSVQATAGGASLVFASSRAADDGDPVSLGRRQQGDAVRSDAQADSAGPSPHVRLHLEGGGLGEAETYLVFDAAATAGRDPFDVDRMAPMATAYATLWLDAQDGAHLAFDGRSMATGQESFALRLSATVPGAYTLSWPDWHEIPPRWRLTLHDRTTGREVDLRTSTSTVVQLDATDAERGPARFTLRVTDPDRVDPNAAPILPDDLRLAPNQPNPFRDETTLGYALPNAARVRLAVYDALGREVAVLIDRQQEAGWHTVRWDAAGATSGTYLVRLVADGGVQTQTVTVVR